MEPRERGGQEIRENLSGICEVIAEIKKEM